MTNLANILTVGRLFLLPPLIVLFYFDTPWAVWTCVALYTIGAVTDWLDGWVARKFNQTSAFGTFMDPISDKIFVVTVLMMLIAVDRVNGLWVLGVLIILTREFLVSGMREFLGPRNIRVPVTRLAKWKTAVQMIATGFLIASPLSVIYAVAGNAGLAAAAVLTVITGWNYLKAGWHHIKD